MKLVSRRVALMGLAAGAGVAVAACSTAPGSDEQPAEDDPGSTDEPAAPDESDEAPHHVVVTQPIPSAALEAPTLLDVTRAVFDGATAVVVAATADVASAEATARELGLPLLLDDAELAAELDRLGTTTVIASSPVDVGDREVFAPGDDVEGLPLTPTAQDDVALLLDGETLAPGVAAALAAAGIEVVDTLDADPRTSSESVAAMRDAAGVLGLGAFQAPERFADRVEAAKTLPELPGGGVAPFPGRMMIALYGHPSGPTLGVLGEQGPEAAVDRVNALAAEYQELTDTPVIGCFEIITTVATAAAQRDGNYSGRTAIADLLPYIEAAEAGGVYVVLDLQPGLNDFLTQAQEYEELLRRPNVGLALDPEWRLRPGQRHMTIIGQVEIDEVNATGAWLADLVAEHQLPPKVLVLHQFQTRMIIDRGRLDTSRDEVQYLIHADGHGTHGQKLETWNALRPGLDEHTRLGWKNFIDEDSPMMTPAQTMQLVQPTPDFVSYQ
ncbi:MAG: hypothetical protein GX596_13835 [Propionibacterium sp.]|nr:hypothetical protein [Propionibacterium sp.]